MTFRRAYVTVIGASTVTLVAAPAAANPPAPSSVPDPLAFVPLRAGETPHRLRRHDGGCYLYGANGPVARAECVKGVEHAGEEIEREPESGQCVLIEPWVDEPRETPCPAVLVPQGWVRTKARAPAASAPASPTESRSGCKCDLGRGATPSSTVLAAAVCLALGVRQRITRASSGTRRRR